jgi:hypothetical protein
MRRSDFTLVFSLALFAVTSCSSGKYMELRQCPAGSSCLNFQRGVTKQEFRRYSQTTDGHRSREYRLGPDVWDVWVYDLHTPSGQASYDRATGDPDPLVGVYLDSGHQEYVAFKNGRLEEWGWGTLPGVLRRNSDRIQVLPGSPGT